MRPFQSRILIASLFLILAACGKGEHMPIDPLAPGAQNKTGQGPGAGNGGGVLFADVKLIFKRTCASCHAPGGALPNWQDYAVSFAKKDRLYERVIVKKDMPLGGGLTDEERKLIGKWLSGGALGEPVAEEPTPTPEPVEPSEPTPVPEPTPEPVEPVVPEPVPKPTDPGPPPNGPILTFNKDIRPIFEKNCTMCHNANLGLPNWTEYDVAFAKKDRLMDRVVVKKDMPMGLPMSDEDRALVESWLNSGALKE